jgi:hypothetical protein
VSGSSSGVERAWRVAAALLAVAHGGWIWWLSSQSFGGPSGPFWGFASNSIHFALFALLALLLLEACRSGGAWSREALVGVLVVTVTYGLVDEWHQTWTPGRAADPFDVLVDLLGGVGAVSLWWGIRGPGRVAPALLRAVAIGGCAAALNAWRAWGPAA